MKVNLSIDSFYFISKNRVVNFRNQEDCTNGVTYYRSFYQASHFSSEAFSQSYCSEAHQQHSGIQCKYPLLASVIFNHKEFISCKFIG